MTGRPSLVLIAALYAAWKTFYTVQTGAEAWRVALFAVAAVLLGGLAVAGLWARRRRTDDP